MSDRFKRILFAEGDGQSVRRVAKKFTASLRVYVGTEYNNRPALELLVTPSGQWELIEHGKSVAQGLIGDAS